MQSLKKIKQINQDADADFRTLRLSMDAKNRVKIGKFSRGGKSYSKIQAYDHDFGGEYITPQGILLPEYDEVKIYFTSSKVTANFIADILVDFWENNKNRFPGITKIGLNQDNGPECNSSRTQFIKRMCEFSGKYGITIYLAYYPPYHSKYNPIERVWGILELHWNGSILDTPESVINFAKSMKWKGQNPEIHFMNTLYKTGIRLDKKTMTGYENLLIRDKELGKWFVEIKPDKCKSLVYPKLW